MSSMKLSENQVWSHAWQVESMSILRQGLPNVKPVERGALASTQVEVKLLSRKQEINKKFNGLRTHSSFL
jgi:hypothetical protein